MCSKEEIAQKISHDNDDDDDDYRKTFIIIIIIITIIARRQIHRVSLKEGLGLECMTHLDSVLKVSLGQARETPESDNGGGGCGSSPPLSRACQDLGVGRLDDSFPASAFFSFFPTWRSACAHQFHSLGQDQSTVAQRVACELVSLIGSHTMHGQHSQQIPTSFGQRCMHV